MPTNAETITGRLRKVIEECGDISLEHFWREAMTSPDKGYYTSGAPIGVDGDFITAPEISQIFGELIGLWLADNWIRAGTPKTFDLVEIGPGRGQLMADALRATKSMSGFQAGANLSLVEKSKAYRSMQAKKLSTYSPTWLDSWQQLPEGGQPLFLIANEFLDALPICQFEFVNNTWMERRIVWSEGSFAFKPTRTITPAASDNFQNPSQGTVLEVSEERDALIRAISKRIAKNGGIALFIDYGYGAAKLGDSFQALANGKPVNPLDNPGSADLTSHVNFFSVVSQARAAGAEAFGPVDQGVFLLRLGAEIRATQLASKATPEKTAIINQGLKRLVHPLQMGSLFKVVAISRNGSPVPAGFD